MDDILKNIREGLPKIREWKGGLTQSQLGEILGCQGAYVSKIEKFVYG